MRRVLIVVSLVVTAACFAAEPSWNPADAPKDAEKDISARHVQFYWSGTIAVMPVGVPIEFALQYPQANAGEGCFVKDIEFRKKQEEYARRYNAKMYEFVSKNPEIGKLKPN